MRPRPRSHALVLALALLAAAALLWFLQPLGLAGGGAGCAGRSCGDGGGASTGGGAGCAGRPCGDGAGGGASTRNAKAPGLDRKSRGERWSTSSRDEIGDPRPIRWRHSEAIGLPHAGRLVRGVRLPAEGAHYFTWDPIRRRSPNRAWRRWGTDDLVRATLRVVRAYAGAHPGAPRVGIGDLSRPHGGDFGPAFGAIGHATHQNGLDVDIYYPLRSGAERAPLSVDEIDLTLAQDLVDRFVSVGAVKVYVGQSTGLTGPPAVVQAIPLHDNHLHARLPG